MFVTNEFARTMLCPQSGPKRLTCVAERCMAWRPVTLYAAYVTYVDKGGKNCLYSWKIEKQEGATAVDCGFCGEAGPPHYTAEIRAPIGYDETSLVGLSGGGSRSAPIRSVNRHEKVLMKRRGQIIENDDGVRCPSLQFRFAKPRKERDKK